MSVHVIAAPFRGLARFARRLPDLLRRRGFDDAELRRLDDHALRDLGLARCELDSLRAEAERRVERTRLRVVRGF